jgi:hypothetical protein
MFAAKTIRRLGALPEHQDPPKALDFRFIERGWTGAIFIVPSGGSSSLIVCITGRRSSITPEIAHYATNVLNEILLALNQGSPDKEEIKIVVRHEGIVVNVD